MTKVLMISRDENILKDGSDAAERMKEYGALADELHIVVFSKRIRNQESGIKTLGKNIFIYPTASRNRWSYAVDAYRVAKRIIRDSKFVIHNSLITAQDPFEAGVAGWCVARKSGTPLQLQIHTDLFSPYFKKESIINFVRVQLAKFLIPRATCVRAVSERIRRSVAVQVPTTVLPIFVDVQKIHDAPVRADLRAKYPQFDFLILMASRFTKEKNIPMAIIAMTEIVKKHPKAGLIIVGSGPEKEKYETLIAAERLEKSVVLEAWTDDLASYYKTADVFMLTSNYEGYGRTVMEAEAAGCPVIMTDVGVAGEIIKDKENGLIVPVGNAQALAGTINSVVEKRVSLTASLPVQPSKEAYVEAYKRTWEQCMIK